MTDQTAVGDELEPWEMQPGESPLGYQVFCQYRDLGPNRGMRRIARKTARDGDTAVVQAGVASMARIQLWSVRWDWVARAQAYDRHLAEIRRQAIEDEHVEMAHRQARAAIEVQNLAMARLLGGADVEGLKPADLKPVDVIRWLEVGQKIERLARGEPDTIQRHEGPDGGPVRVAAVTSDEEMLANMRVLEAAGAIPSGSADGMARTLGIVVVDDSGGLGTDAEESDSDDAR